MAKNICHVSKNAKFLQAVWRSRQSAADPVDEAAQVLKFAGTWRYRPQASISENIDITGWTIFGPDGSAIDKTTNDSITTIGALSAICGTEKVGVPKIRPVQQAPGIGARYLS